MAASPKMSSFICMSTLFAPLTKTVRCLQERGLKGMLVQLYTIGDLKFGELKGTDQFNNKYYEDLDLPFGQHRWVEYADIHNPDASMITPDWHGWMHHVFDETPDELRAIEAAKLPTTRISHAPYTVHVGGTEAPLVDKAQHDVTQYRQRGYKIGSLMSEPEDKDLYYRQPGHPLYDGEVVKGRFDTEKGMDIWTPEEEEKTGRLNKFGMDKFDWNDDEDMFDEFEAANRKKGSYAETHEK